MFCPKCGSQNPDDAAQCSQCGATLPHAPPRGAAEASPQSDAGSPPGTQPQPQWQQPQVPVQPLTAPVNLTTSWILAAVSALCCCLPLGIAGIVYAAQANTRMAQGDYSGAADLAKKSNMFSIIGIGLGAVGIVLWLLLTVVSAASAMRPVG